MNNVRDSVFVVKNAKSNEYLSRDIFFSEADTINFGSLNSALQLPNYNFAKELMAYLESSCGIHDLTIEGPIQLEDNVSEDEIINTGYSLLAGLINKHEKAINKLQRRFEILEDGKISKENFIKFILNEGLAHISDHPEMSSLVKKRGQMVLEGKFEETWVLDIFEHGMKLVEETLNTAEIAERYNINNTTPLDDEMFYGIVKCAAPHLDVIYDLFQRSKKLGLMIDINNYLFQVWYVGQDTIPKDAFRIAEDGNDSELLKGVNDEAIKHGISFFQQHLRIDENMGNPEILKMKYGMIGRDPTKLT